MTGRWYRALGVAGGVVAIGLTGWQVWRVGANRPSRGQQVYDENCSVCHGVRGDGKGKAAYLLLPKPRNFRAGKFRFVTHRNLEPTREDLFRTITYGLADTAMPSWGQLPQSDRWALADYTLKLNWEGWVEVAERAGDAPRAAEKYANETVEPGDPIPIPPEPAVTPRGLEDGRKYYLTACAKCHGTNGEGKRDPTWRTSEGFPTWSRNFRRGVFKGGREDRQVYLRFSTGMPGTPMPSTQLSGEQVWRVVQYVLSLSDPAAQERAQIRAKEIVAARAARLPSHPQDTTWESVPEVPVPLMPLWWHEGFVDAVRVKAVHDGERLALRLEWNDSTQDSEGIRQQTFSDGAAVQLTASASAPLFAMGVSGQAVNIWHWKSLWSADQKQFQDVGSAYPRMLSDAYYGSQKGWHSPPLEDPMFSPAANLHNSVALLHRPGAVEDASAAGFGTYTPQELKKQDLQAEAHWKDGVWRVQFTRSLRGSAPGDVALRADGPASAAFAVWDGSAGDRNGQKSVSIWNSLILK